MSNNAVNTGRRRFLTAATSAVGVAGVVGIAVPFRRLLEPQRQGAGGRSAGQGRHQQD